jgi:hypothetical protein
VLLPPHGGCVNVNGVDGAAKQPLCFVSLLNSLLNAPRTARAQHVTTSHTPPHHPSTRYAKLLLLRKHRLDLTSPLPMLDMVLMM